MTDANTNGIWFWIHSLQPAEFLPWGVWQPDGVSGVNGAIDVNGVSGVQRMANKRDES